MGRKTLTKEIFIEKSNIVHNNKYQYDKTVYVHSKKKVLITCPYHGNFEQTPCLHMQGSGCKLCRNEDFSNKYKGPKRSVYTTAFSQYELNAEFIKQAKATHGNRYNYDKSIYTDNSTPLIITCNIHGDFTQSPTIHYKGGNCVKCSCIYNLKYTTKEFVEIAMKIHSNKYDYSKFTYLGTREGSTILCPEHGEFTQLPEVHLLGSGCPECAVYGFKRNKPAILYYLSINNGEAYKIGITNTSLQTRFGSDMKKINILSEWEFSLGEDAYNIEQEIIRVLSNFKYSGPPLLKVGNTELFAVCVLDKIKTILDNRKCTSSLEIT